MDQAARFGGIERLYGTHEAQVLAKAHVCVIGLGGVGSWVVEALSRTGIGKLTLVDLDEVCASNINRQLHALTSTVGRSKAHVLRERAVQINPLIDVTVIEDFFTAKTAEMILAPAYDVVVDCIDQFKNKVVMLDMCRRLEQRIVVVGSAGGRKDPTRIKVADMSASSGDVLLAMLRKRLRQKHGFPRKGTWGVKCVYSDEIRAAPATCEVPVDDGRTELPPENRKSLRLDCSTGYGAATFVTGTFGFFAAAAAVDLILRRATSYMSQ